MRNLTLFFCLLTTSLFAQSESDSIFFICNGEEVYIDTLDLINNPAVFYAYIESLDCEEAQDWANAIWYYEKSLKLERNDKTIQNLELANLKIIDRIEDIPQLFYKKWWSSFISIFNTFSWQLISILIIWLALTIKILSQFTNYKKEHFLSILYSLALISVFATYSSYQRNITKKEAIIFTSSIVVNSAPTTNSTNLFSLHSGSKIEILDTIGEWINIKIANGSSGCT